MVVELFSSLTLIVSKLKAREGEDNDGFPPIG
jgi:hypothetical protein